MSHLTKPPKTPAYVRSLLEPIDDHLQGSSCEQDADHAVDDIDSTHAYTRREAAAMLDVSLWTIDRARKDGLLREVNRLGVRFVRITGESIARFKRERQRSNAHVRVQTL